MSLFVNLYWGGKIIQSPGVGIAYDPPCSRGYLILNECVSYDELISMICEKIGIEMNLHRIEVVWRHAVLLGNTFTYVGTTLDEGCMQYMFSEVIHSGQVELIIDYAMIAPQQFQPTVTYEVGTSSQHPSFPYDNMVNTEERDFEIGHQLDVGGIRLGYNSSEDNTFVPEGHDNNSDSTDSGDSDLNSPWWAENSDEAEVLSSESGDDSSDDEVFGVSKPYVPTVRGEQPVPQYVPTGSQYFRSVPSEVGGYNASNYGVNANNIWYWDESNPTYIGLGTKFDSKLHLKTAVTLWHVEAVRQYKVEESKGKRWHAVCKYPYGLQGRASQTGLKCSWVVKATLRQHDGRWEIRTWVNGHTCLGHRNSRGHANLSSSMIALCVRHQIENDVDYKPAAIKEHVEDKYHVQCSYKKAWYARRKAIELVYGGWEQSFRELPIYMAELQKQNPGTVVEWFHDERLSHGDRKVFKYVFWAFGAALHAFQSCKPVLTVDGTHLRGRFKGKLLIAVGFDASKKCLPVAYAIVDEETNQSWNWFMGLVRVYVATGDRELCIISDRHHGIINAMNSDLWQQPPQAHHRYCLVHVRKNVLQSFKGIQVKNLVWATGIATQKRKFIKRRRALANISNGAVRYLRELDKSKWSLAYDKCRRWGEATTNMVECYNNVLKGARELPIRACIDMTLWRTIEWFISRTTEAQHWQGDLTPWAQNKVNENDARGQGHRVRRCDIQRGIYEVRTRQRAAGKGGNSHTVEYLKGKCSCGKWQMWRIPCSHVAAVVRDRGDDIFDLVNRVYHKDVWMEQYSGYFIPLRHPDYWNEIAWTLECPSERLLPRSRGRYRRARIPNQMDVREPDQPRASRRCKNCGETGHDRRNCTTGRTT